MKKTILFVLLMLSIATAAYAGWATLNGYDSSSGRNDQIEKGTDANPLYVSFI